MKTQAEIEKHLAEYHAAIIKANEEGRIAWMNQLMAMEAAPEWVLEDSETPDADTD
jgi:hypothetical protein